MKKYETNGEVIAAEGPTDLVRKMAAGSFAPARDLDRWMEQTSRRATEQTGHPVRWDSPQNFIADLISAGLIKVLP